MHFRIVIIYLSGFLIAGGQCDCSALTRTGWSSEWLYSVFRTIFEFDESCTWTLKPPSNATDILLVVKISRIDNFDDSDVIIMPDGDLLTSSDITSDSLTPWTATYRHRDATPTRACQHTSNNMLTPNDVKISRSWPPKIRTTTSDLDIVISYSFTYCDDYRAVTVRSAWPAETF